MSSFVSGGRMNVKVGGKVAQKGAEVGSAANGQSGIEAQEGIFKEDVYASYNESNFGFNARLGATNRGGHKVEVDKQSAYGKLDYGEQQLIQQATSEGEVRTIANTGMSLSVDSEAVKAVASPVETVKDIADDVKAIYSAGEGVVRAFAANKKDENGERALGARGVLAAIKFSCEDAAGLHATSKDEETKEALNNANDLTADELEDKLKTESKKIQSRDGIAPENQADLQLYQGEDGKFANSALKGNKAGYDVDNNKTYINTQGTDLSRGGDIVQSLYHEAQRKANKESNFLRNQSESQQTNLATFRGEQAGRTWNRLTGANKKSRPEANRAWNTRNSQAMKSRNEAVSKHGEVKPRVLEWFDKAYRDAVKRGDKEEAQRIKAKWEKVEDVGISFVPVVGSAKEAYEQAKEGNVGSALYNTGWAVAEGVGVGLVGKGVKAVKMVVKGRKVMKAVKGTENGAKLATNGVKLAKQLASEEQMKAVGRIIIENEKLRAASRLANQYGGKAANWVKKGSENFTKNGKQFRTHWYENLKNGLRVESKTKLLK